MKDEILSGAQVAIAARAMIAVLQEETRKLEGALDELKRRSASVQAREDRCTQRERELEKQDANGITST